MRREHRPTRMWRAALLLLVLLAGPALDREPGQEVHGKDSVFAGHGVAIACGVLKEAVEEETQVVIRIVPIGDSTAYISLDGVDPFTANAT